MKENGNMIAEPGVDYREMTGEQLAALVAAGMDERACAELVRRHRKGIYFEIRKIVRNLEDAEDLTIDSLAKAFINIRQYRPEYKFSTWLNKIAANSAIDFLRKKKNNTISLDNWIEDKEGQKIRFELDSKELNPEELMERKQRARQLYKAVQKLRPGYADVVNLRYFRQYSYVEIAAKLNLPLGTVKGQLHRARKELYKLLHQSRIQQAPAGEMKNR